MNVVQFLQTLSRYPHTMEVLIYDPSLKRAVEVKVALRVTKPGVTPEPPALILYPEPKV